MPLHRRDLLPHQRRMGLTMAFYFCVVTMCTVGYGDTTLTKPSSRAFTIFYIMSSCVLVTLAIGNVAHISIQIKSEKKKLRMLNRKLDFNFLRELDMGDNGMDKTMFPVAMLVQQELVKKEKDVDPWLAKFDELDVNGDGVIDFDDAIEDLQNELSLEAGSDIDEPPGGDKTSINTCWEPRQPLGHGLHGQPPEGQVTGLKEEGVEELSKVFVTRVSSVYLFT